MWPIPPSNSAFARMVAFRKWCPLIKRELQNKYHMPPSSQFLSTNLAVAGFSLHVQGRLSIDLASEPPPALNGFHLNRQTCWCSAGKEKRNDPSNWWFPFRESKPGFLLFLIPDLWQQAAASQRSRREGLRASAHGAARLDPGGQRRAHRQDRGRGSVLRGRLGRQEAAAPERVMLALFVWLFCKQHVLG